MDRNRASEPSRFGFIFLPILAYAGIYYVVDIVAFIFIFAFSVIAIKQSGGALDYTALTNEMLLQISRVEYEISAVASLVSIPIFWKFFLCKDRNRSELLGRRYDTVSPVYYLLTLILGVGACLGLNGMLAISGIMGALSEDVEQVASVLYQGQLIVELIGIGIITPIAEEFVFRGVIMSRIRELFPERPVLPILFSAVLFGCYHGNMIQMIYAGILGLVLGYVYDKYRRLMAPILVHIGANLISVIGSETNLLDGLFLTDRMQFITTGIGCLLVLICLGVINSKVEAKPLT